MIPFTAPQNVVASRRRVVCAVQREQTASVPSAMLAVGLSVGIALCPMVNPPPVSANSYSDRVAAMEQRRKLLQETKEKALGESSDSSSNANSYLESMKSSLSMKIPELPPSTAPEEEPQAPAPEPPRANFFNFSKSVATEEADTKPAEAPAEPPASKMGFSWSSPTAKTTPKPAEPEPATAKDSDNSAPWWEQINKLADSATTSTPPKPAQTPEPAPAPALTPPPAPKPAPAAAPAPAPAPRPVVEAKKAEEPKKAEQPKAAAEQSKKRRGPLPMFLAQFLLLAAYAGGIYAVLFQSGDIVKTFDSLRATATEKLKALQANASPAAK